MVSDQLKIEGDPSPAVQIWIVDLDDRPVEKVAAFNTIADAHAFRWRADRRYKIQVSGRRWLTVPEFMHLPE